jgi:hypothetical protein
MAMVTFGFCRELSIAEPLAGTGNDEIERWILVEHGGPWGVKALRDAELPAATREWLCARDDEAHTRVQLIRRPGSHTSGRATVFVAAAMRDAAARRLVELELPLEHIPELDPDALLARAPTPDPRELAAVYLVCTHGTRDRCCAKWGMAVFDALREHEGERVWQCSHLGGHRFAPTFLTLPSGLLWGRVEQGELAALRASLAVGRLSSLSKLRGRCCHPRVVQAAECLLRERESLVDDDALVFIEQQPLAEGAHQICFEHGRERVEIIVEAASLGVATPGSCGDPLEPRSYFRLLGVTRTPLRSQ